MAEDQGMKLDPRLQEFLSQPFNSLLFSLVNTTLLSMGMIANPMTGKNDQDLDQAQVTIDMIAALQEKTRGNLTAEEQHFLDSQLTELRMLFVEAVKKGSKIII
jgi:hypothetical protein